MSDGYTDIRRLQDAQPKTWLHVAWEQEARAARLRDALKRAEEDRDEALSFARRDGIESVDLGHGVVKLITKPGTKTRVLDVEAFKREYPKAFKKCATYSVKLTDAEKELGTTLLGELCTIREGAERLSLTFEPTFVPAPFREESTP
jgi:hypothetical protein